MRLGPGACSTSSRLSGRASDQLGHSSIAITLDLYTHPTDERKREDANRFDAFLRTVRDSAGH